MSIRSISSIIWKNLLVIGIFIIIFGLFGGLYAKYKKHTVYESIRNIMMVHSYS